MRSFPVALQNGENRVQWMQHDSFGFILEDSRYAGTYDSQKVFLGGYGHLCGDCDCRGDGAAALHASAFPHRGQTASRGADHRHRKQAEQRKKVVERYALPRRFPFRDMGGFFAERRNARRARRNLRRDAVHQRGHGDLCVGEHGLRGACAGRDDFAGHPRHVPRSGDGPVRPESDGRGYRSRADGDGSAHPRHEHGVPDLHCGRVRFVAV